MVTPTTCTTSGSPQSTRRLPGLSWPCVAGTSCTTPPLPEPTPRVPGFMPATTTPRRSWVSSWRSSSARHPSRCPSPFVCTRQSVQLADELLEDRDIAGHVIFGVAEADHPLQRSRRGDELAAVHQVEPGQPADCWGVRLADSGVVTCRRRCQR